MLIPVCYSFLRCCSWEKMRKGYIESTYFFLFLSFFWQHCVAYGTFPTTQPEIESMILTAEAQTLNHWTTGESSAYFLKLC